MKIKRRKTHCMMITRAVTNTLSKYLLLCQNNAWLTTVWHGFTQCRCAGILSDTSCCECDWATHCVTMADFMMRLGNNNSFVWQWLISRCDWATTTHCVTMADFMMRLGNNNSFVWQWLISRCDWATTTHCVTMADFTMRLGNNNSLCDNGWFHNAMPEITDDTVDS